MLGEGISRSYLLANILKVFSFSTHPVPELLVINRQAVLDPFSGLLQNIVVAFTTYKIAQVCFCNSPLTRQKILNQSGSFSSDTDVYKGFDLLIGHTRGPAVRKYTHRRI